MTSKSRTRSGDPQPLMPDEDIDAFVRLLTLHRPRFVLEWGCGGSTVRFSRLPGIEGWHAIEHNQDWIERITPYVNERVALHHAALGSEEYVSLPRQRGWRPDLVIVDGRRRNECLRVASEIVDPNGVVLLHDASRQRYQAGMAAFAFRKVLTAGCGEHRPVDTECVNGLFWHQGVTVLSNGPKLST